MSDDCSELSDLNKVKPFAIKSKSKGTTKTISQRLSSSKKKNSTLNLSVHKYFCF